MPVKACKLKGKSGYKWGDSGKCYTYTPGNETGKKNARQKAHLQGAAAGYKAAMDRLEAIRQRVTRMRNR